MASAYDNYWLNMNRARESTYDPYAANPYSSARGIDQFIAPTWLSLAKRYRPDWKGLSDAEILNKRYDPKTSEEFVGYNNQENKNYLTSKGYGWNNTNMSLAHRFGPAGTVALLSADPAAPISSVVSSKVMAQNPDLKGKTVNDVITGYMDKTQSMPGPQTPPSGSNAPLKTATLQDARNLVGIPNPQQAPIQPPTNEAVVGSPTPMQASAGGGYDWGNALLSVGAGLSSIDNPSGASIALGMLRDRQKTDEWDLVKAGNSLYRVNKRTGEISPFGPQGTGGVDNPDFDKADAKEAVKELTAAQNAAQDGQNRLQKLQELRSYADNPNVYQGFAGGAVAALKNAAKTFGFDEAALGNDETQAFRALSNQFALSIRNPKAGEGLPGNLSDKDLAFLRQSTPNLDNSPGANKKIVDFMYALEQKNMEMNAEKARFISENKGRTGLQEHMQQYAKKLFEQLKQEQGLVGGTSDSVIDYKDL